LALALAAPAEKKGEDLEGAASGIGFGGLGLGLGGFGLGGMQNSYEFNI